MNQEFKKSIKNLQRKERVEAIQQELQRKRTELESLELHLQREMIFFKAGDTIDFYGTGYPTYKLIHDGEDSISAINLSSGKIEFPFKLINDPSRISCLEMDSFLETGPGYVEVKDIKSVNGREFSLKHRIPDNIEEYIKEATDNGLISDELGDILLEVEINEEDGLY